MTPAAATVKRWREEPRGILQFGNEQYGVTYDRWQEEALLAFASPLQKYKRISLQACVGPGKTMVLAHAGLWFLGVQGDALDHPQGACVAITGDNLRDNLWKEYAKWINRSPFLRAALSWSARRIQANDHPEDWFLSARSWPKSANAEEQGATLSGLHSKYVLCQADESGAIPTTILRAGEQALAQAGGGFAKFMQAGNPVSLEGMLHEAATTLRHLWHVIRITGDPDDPHAWIHSPRVGEEPKRWALEQIASYGRDNPWVMSYILGRFPPASINALLGIEDVEAAMHRHLRIDEYDYAQKRIGIDVARFGDDRTVLFPRQGRASFRPITMRNARTTEIAARALLAGKRWTGRDGECPLFLVDDTGHWGHGVIDNLQTVGVPCIPINYAGKALDPRFKNRRVEMWLKGAEAIKNGAALPPIQEMVAELTQPTYTFMNGVFVLEEKDQIKKRLGRSPDLADAYMQTYAIEDMPAGVMAQFGGTNKVARDADPYAVSDSGKVIHDADPWR